MQNSNEKSKCCLDSCSYGKCHQGQHGSGNMICSDKCDCKCHKPSVTVQTRNGIDINGKEAVFIEPSVEVSKCCGAVKKECRGHWCSDNDCSELTCSNCGLKFEPSLSDIPENTEVTDRTIIEKPPIQVGDKIYDGKNVIEVTDMEEQLKEEFIKNNWWDNSPETISDFWLSKLDLLLKQQKDGIVKEIKIIPTEKPEYESDMYDLGRSNMKTEVIETIIKYNPLSLTINL